MKKTIKLNLNDYNCPPQFQEQYVKEICKRENVDVVDWHRWEEKIDVFPGIFKGTLIYLEGEI